MSASVRAAAGPPAKDDELIRLIHAHLEQELDQEGYARLDALLAQNPDHQRRFVRMTSDHHALRLALRSAPRSLPRARQGVQRPRNRTLSLRRVAPWAGAAALLAFAGTWLLHARSAEPGAGASTPVAATGDASGPGRFLPHLASSSGVVMLRRGGTAQTSISGMLCERGDELRTAGASHARLVYDDGSAIEVEADTEIVLGGSIPHAPGAGIVTTLVQGSLRAEFTHQDPGHEACIVTDESITQVVGTRLAVARADAETCTEVTLGRVLVQRRSDQQTIAVSAGERALVAPALPLSVQAQAAPYGRLLQVGPGRGYASMKSLPTLAAGDVVEIDPGTYRESVIWDQSGTTLRPIVIRGVGASPVVFDGSGCDLSGVGAVPRALMQIRGDHYVIEHLDFINAHNHANAAAIRTLAATTLTVTDCRISHCDDGIFTVQGEIEVADCDIGFCGTPEHESLCHELYLSGSSAWVHDCVLHDALYGQAIKCASHYIELTSNRITDADDGEISCIDGEFTGHADSNVVMIGNLIVSKSDRQGNHQRFIAIASENGGVRHGNLYAFANTFVAHDARVIFVDLGQLQGGLVASDNLFWGSDQIIQGTPRSVLGQRNWLPHGDHSPPVGFSGSVPITASATTSADPGFTDPLHGDYHLQPGSSALQPGGGVPERYRDGAGFEHVLANVHEPPSSDGTLGAVRQDGVIGACSLLP